MDVLRNLSGALTISSVRMLGIPFCIAKRNKSAEMMKAEKKLNEIAKRMGVSKRLQIRNTSFLSSDCQAHGLNCLPGNAGVTLKAHNYKGKSLYFNASEQERSFILAHEVAHIKANDLLTFFLVPTIVAIAVGIFFPAIAALTWLVTFIATSRLREQQADLTAMKYLPEEKKQGGILLFRKIQRAQLAYRKTGSFWARIRVDKEGNNRFDLLHPSFSTRIRKMEEFCNQPSTKKPAKKSWLKERVHLTPCWKLKSKIAI